MQIRCITFRFSLFVKCSLHVLCKLALNAQSRRKVFEPMRHANLLKKEKKKIDYCIQSWFVRTLITLANIIDYQIQFKKKLEKGANLKKNEIFKCDK